VSALRDAAMRAEAAWACTVLVETSSPGLAVLACAAAVSTMDRQASSMLGTKGATVSAV